VNMKKDLKSAAFFRMSPSGGTALYDGVAQMVLASTQMHVNLTKEISKRGVNVITYVVVLTDGEDTASKLNLAQTQKILAQVNQLNNFKIIFAGISLDYKSSQALRALGSVGDRDIEFRELRSSDDIKNLFEHVTVQLQLQRTIGMAVIGDDQSRVITTSTQSYPIGPGGRLMPSVAPSASSYPAIRDSSYSSSGPQDWQTGLCDCTNDWGICLCGLCCPCILFGQNAEKVTPQTGCCAPCCCYLICSLIGCCCCFHLTQRQKIMTQYSLKDEPPSLCAAWCCSWCANCQEARELGIRGASGPQYQYMS